MRNKKEVLLVMEYFEGFTLETVMKERFFQSEKFEGGEIRHIINSLLGAISYIHSLNIIHRDIKPDNIIVPLDLDYTKLKLCDFGLCTIADGPIVEKVEGSAIYMAPELIMR